MKKKHFNTDDHIYLQVADGLEKMIAEEVLRIGDKLPSVRILSDEYGISVGTALQAYYELEGKGLIESRPKSGYYVRFNHHRFPKTPDQVKPDTGSHEVSVKDMITSIYSDIVSRDVINFAIAVPDTSLLPTAKINKSVVHALRNCGDQCINYEHTQGNAELRQQIVRLAFNWGGKIKPDQVVVTNGCVEAVMMCLKAVAKYGDTIAVECPAYFGIFQLVENLGLKVVEIPSDPNAGLDLVNLEKAIKKHHVKAIIAVPNFNNPMGSSMSDENKKKLVDIVNKYEVPLIEDDIYGELYFGKSRPKNCKSFDTKGLVMYCTSISKTLAPGFRIGWTIPGRFFEEVKQNKRIQNISGASLTQAAMAHFLKTGRYEYHLKNLRKALQTQSLQYMQAIIQYFPGDVKVSRPGGGFIFWIELNKKIDSFKLRTEAMKHKISIVPGKIFSAGINYSNYIRLSFGKPWSEDVDYGLMMLGKLVKKMSGERN